MSTFIENPLPAPSVKDKTDIPKHHPEPELSAELSKGDIETLTRCLESSTLENKDPITIVDTVSSVVELLESLTDLPVNPPSLFIDLEGVNLSRHGTISILQIFVHPKNQTFLVDIHTLGAKAFTHVAPHGMSLRSVLESSWIPKVFFDVRNDSDALFNHYEIELAGVQDLQLMELASRVYPGRYLSGLGRCIENQASMTASERAKWKACKEAGRKLFAPDCGGSYEVFNVRPLSQEIIQYCVQDVQFLPQLWQKYNRWLPSCWEPLLETEVRNRIALSKSTTYNGKGRHMALAPRGWA